MSNLLDVYVLDRLVGLLSDEGNQFVFSYLPNTPQDHVVSLTMPVRLESYVWQRALFPIFQQNLPEGFKKDLIRQRLGPHADVTDWGLLELTGKNVIGRVRVVPHGLSVRTELTNIEAARILASTDSQSSLLLYLNEGVLEGISGVMPKAFNGNAKATIWTDDVILKTGTQDIPGLAINEYLCLEVARAAGLNVPETTLSQDGQVLTIARFDRRSGQQIAVEDFCSIAAFDPVNKYKGTLERLADLHNEYVTSHDRQESAKHLYKLILLNYALHNGDAHLKNFALIYSNYNDAILAPVYDIVTTSAYPHLEDRPAMTLQGKKAWWMGKQLRTFGATRLSLLTRDLDDAELNIHHAIDQTFPLISLMIERYPYFRDTGKRMLLEWTNGKQDITASAKKRAASDRAILDEMTLSDVKTQKKKSNHRPDSLLKMKKGK
ncbi:type II toxin-antitoxin system HipA family toxin [Undibacterium sp. RuTC16W]|uniref:type II toxin-antitoxin system HipA family toxin n=1 Tax=Undibacterium sp. RuTC16W TaxID=3413048 RepID=UPI003BF15B26